MLIVGAGFSGSVVARILAEAGRDVVILEERDHIGGNAYDYYNSDGILVHKYGPHAFHTNSKRIYAFLSRFTEWRPFSLRVQANIDGMIVPLPVNATTISRLFGRDAEQYLAEKRVFKSTLANSEDVVLSRVGPDLCEKIFRHYTKKQWGLDLKEIGRAHV